MKKVSFLFCILVLSATMLLGQTTGPKFEYAEEAIELGTYYTDSLELIKLEIEFTNTGDQPLVVTSVRGCCGTRITGWTREPVKPGEKGIINAEFRPAPRAHVISRTITAMSNDQSGQKIIRLRGKVEEPTSGFNPQPAAKAPTAR
jgi:hypothetical protein